MQSKLNIFQSLQHASDSEEDNDPQKVKAKKIAEKKEQRAHKDDKNKPAGKVQPQTQTGPERQAPKEEHARTKAPYKQKGVSDEPHPQDRHSGHLNQAYGNKPKKSGAGKGNWGNYREDKRANDEQGEVVAEEGANEEKPQEEEKPAGITLSEYYQQQGQAQNEPQINETKAKITSEQLTKELGTATALKTRLQQQVDDKKVGRKKDRLDVNHHAGLNSEHGNLLNFRTGFVEKEYRQRGIDEVPGQQKRGPRTGGQKERENAKEEETQPQSAEQNTEAQPVEREQAQEGTAEVQTPTQTQGQGQGQGQDNRRRNEGQGQRGGRGGYRGDRPQGDRQQGDRQQGDRPQGDRPPRKQYGAKDQGKVNFEDESAFPKLG